MSSAGQVGEQRRHQDLQTNKNIFFKKNIVFGFERSYSRMNFPLFLLPVLGQTLSNTIILDTESESEGDAFVLERVKRGFYT